MVRARRMRSIPSAVLGPVLAPPCIRHLPFAIAGPLHAFPLLVRAPQRGACNRPLPHLYRSQLGPSRASPLIPLPLFESLNGLPNQSFQLAEDSAQLHRLAE